jgi:hypothetical protein
MQTPSWKLNKTNIVLQQKRIQSGELESLMVRNNPMMLFFTKPTQAMIRFDVQYKSKMAIPQKGVK